MTTDLQRRRARTRRALALLAALALSVISLGAAQPSGGEPDAHGYWFMSPVGAADPSVPEDGMLVMGAPSGAISVAGLRFTLDDPDEVAASIHLTIDQDSRDAFIEEPLIWACPAERDWESAQGGSAEEAPGETCSPGTASRASLGEDGEEYVFVVSQFIQDGELDILITPGIRGAVPSPLLLQALNEELVAQIGTGVPWPGPSTVEGLDGSNLRVTFAAPDGDTLRTGQDSADDSVTSLEFDGGSGGFDSNFDSEGGAESGGTSDDFGGGSAMADPPSTSGSGGSSPSPSSGASGAPPSPETAEPPMAADGGGDEPVQSTPPDGSDVQAPVALEDPQAGGLSDAEAAGSAGPGPRAIGAVVLALGALGAGVLTMGPQGLALGAGSSASNGGVGGLAQFARPRSGPPPSL